MCVCVWGGESIESADRVIKRLEKKKGMAEPVSECIIPVERKADLLYRSIYL